MKKAIIVDVIASLYILLFLYTGIYKLLGQEYFKAALYKSPLISKYTEIVAVAIPVIEVLIATALLIPFFSHQIRFRKWGLYAGTILMALFTLYVGYMLKFSNGLPCSCGGIIQKMNWHQHFYFNTGFTCLGILGIWLNNKQEGVQNEQLAMS